MVKPDEARAPVQGAVIDPTDFRRVLAHLPTGVTVVTAFGQRGPVGMAANSVTSVSLDPPLILVCPAKASTTWPLIRESGRFCVNVMAHNHEELCRQFAGPSKDRFAGVTWSERHAGPGIDEAVAWIDVELTAEHEAGDHTIAVARVISLEADRENAPLVFFRGEYGRLHSPGGTSR